MAEPLLAELKVRRAWGPLFRAIEKGRFPSPLHCARAWFVAGILYERDQKPPLSDRAYDALSAHLLTVLPAAHSAGADTLNEQDLRAGTAMNWRKFPTPYHQVATLYGNGKVPRKVIRKGQHE